MRRCLLRWEYETPERAFCRFWQRFPRVSFKDHFSGHLTTHCGIKCNSLAPKIARLLPGSEDEACTDACGDPWRRVRRHRCAQETARCQLQRLECGAVLRLEGILAPDDQALA